jgi:cephalosporin hydroxylase
MLAAMPDRDTRRFAIDEYFDAFKRHYPEAMARSGYPVRAMRDWARHEQLGADDGPERFVRLEDRKLTMRQNAWQASRNGDVRWLGASRSYKGLVNLKSPFDLVLYASLIWELQPKTIIEFGALQGGSTLWFADQLDALCGGGEVHSFELHDKCIHPRARHPRATFHAVDLNNIDRLDMELLQRLPHPWLVIDDAHTNIERLAPVIGGVMEVGDYYVWEDLLLNIWMTHDAIGRAIAIARACGLVVDTKYTDAFGLNVTCSPNSWFKKVS